RSALPGRRGASVRGAGPHPRNGRGDPGARHPLYRRHGRPVPAFAGAGLHGALARAEGRSGGARNRADGELTMDMAIILSTLDATLRLSTPLLLACLAGMYSERAGLFDIGLEGKMLSAAFAAAAVAYLTGSAWIGLGAAVGVCILTALLQGLAAITLRGNQLIAGVAINMLAAGLTTF